MYRQATREGGREGVGKKHLLCSFCPGFYIVNTQTVPGLDMPSSLSSEYRVKPNQDLHIKETSLIRAHMRHFCVLFDL